MRRFSPLRLPLLCACLFAVWVLRGHIFVLGEVAYTYAGFPLKQQALCDFPPTPEQLAPGSSQLTPAIIHHINLDEGCVSPVGDTCALKPRYVDNIDSCRALHPDWSFRLWAAANATDFVARYYPDVLPSYQGYRQTIQRANILRYLLLDHFGGVYLDLDLTCRASLEPLRSLPWLTPPAHPVGINNAFILAAPAHAFLRSALIPRIRMHDLRWPLPYVENMLSTGCMFISAMVMRFGTHDMRVLSGGTLHMLRGRVTTPLFEHGGDSSWHRWDASMFLLIGKYVWISLWVLMGAAIATAALLARRQLASRRRGFMAQEKV